MRRESNLERLGAADHPSTAIFHPLLYFLLLFTLILTGCEGAQPDRSAGPAPDPLWTELIASHTSGVISRDARIRVFFATDVVPEDRIGKDAGDVLEIQPAVRGAAEFLSTRELVFAPETAFQPGVRYRLLVRPKGLSGAPESLAPFEFFVRITPPAMDVRFDGLSPDGDSDRMRLSGEVVTADVEQLAKVKQTLTATYEGRAIAIEWRDSGAGDRHAFEIRGLERAAREQTLTVAWDGAPLGARERGRQDFAIPARNRFLVTQVRTADDEERRYIHVFFSEALDPRQDFRGLVRVGGAEPSVRVDGNVLNVYPADTPDGVTTLTLEPGIRSRSGQTLGAFAQYPIEFVRAMPQVRFAGAGVILPEAPALTVPFEAIGVRSVQVAAFRIHERAMGQFLQVNPLGGSYELHRVGRTLWRKTIPLTAADLSKWNRYSLDVTELMKKHPGGMVRLTLSVGREDAIAECDNDSAQVAERHTRERSDHEYWDYEEYYDIDDGSGWADRGDPCKDAYYAYNRQVRDARNFLVSNLGLLAKKDQRGRWTVVATDLRTAQPLSGIEITATSYQNQPLATATTDARGFAEFSLDAPPFTFVAQGRGEKGYLRVEKGAALPVSHFDVGGDEVKGGVKGHIYGERGVWRPGDDIHLTLVVMDKDGALPPDHPVTMELFNPQSQLTQTIVNTTPLNGFYTFKLKTAEDAPTGMWTAKATLGGVTFSKALRIETVAPNRLKVSLDLDKEEQSDLLATGCGRADARCSKRPILKGAIVGQWLSGAVASGLKADVKLRLRATPTRFEGYPNYTFDDPARSIASEPQSVFDGALDAEGRARFETTLQALDGAPGMLSASFTSRVFERGGAFSVNYATHPLSPYSRYVGLRLPTGDDRRGVLHLGERHTIELAGVTAAGEPTTIRNVEVTLYKVEWKWWWDRSGDALAQYAQRTHKDVVQTATVSVVDGKGAWSFSVGEEAWGRYLIRVCDVDGGHCAGRTFYIDWPMWAGRTREQSGPAASVLVLTTDKDKYSVGETATIQLPDAKEGRALFTVESGTSILEARWVDLARESNRIELSITAAMAPNVYAGVTLVQPHGRENDRPIRLYGFVPIHVTDPATSLAPEIAVANEWRPESKATVEVSERSGRAMTYTLAVVDEGLLDLTSFRTPDLHAEFYRREALGVSTWDLFDEVAGAYGGELERLLALGGSDPGVIKNPEERRTRFPPVVRHLGPFELKPNERKRHEIDVPQYIGAVRVMVVAGQHGAYGSAEKSVFVRQPLMLLPTLPRVLGPEEEIAVPVSVFVSDASIERVTLQMRSDDAFEIVGDSSVTLDFTRPDEQLALLKLRARARVGQGRVSFVATSGSHRAAAEVHLDVRSPNPPTTERVHRALEPGESWSLELEPHGLAGTNEVTLEVAAVPPLDLERRLHALISYPYGCLEQTTSAAFPQLYLSSLMRLSDARKREIQHNVQAAIRRLNSFQVPNGSFTYWPGGSFWPERRLRDLWSTSYAGHFLVEASKLGYGVPQATLASWVRFQRTIARGWSGAGEAESLDQAYRLYTLALAGHPEIGAMNRLRERTELTAPARWLLAAAYAHAGLPDAAQAVAKNAPRSSADYSGREHSFGSELRDDAIALRSLVALGRAAEAEPLVDSISRRLASQDWYSTHTVSQALMAMAHYLGVGEIGAYTFEHSVAGKRESTTVTAPLYSERLTGFPDEGAPVTIANTSNRRLFVALTTRGVAKSGSDVAAAQGLSLSIEYRDDAGEPIDVARVRQGTDVIAKIVVANETAHRIDNIALAQLVPAGWEILNDRMEGFMESGQRDPAAPQPWWLLQTTAARAEHVDIRDDRIYRHFSLAPRERITFITRLNAAYRGRYYLPSVSAEAMYDATRYARTQGQWVEVTP